MEVKHPDRVSKRYIGIALGYYWINKKNEKVVDRKMMSRHVYTPDLVEDILGLTYEKFNKIRTFNKAQSKKVLEHLGL